MEEFWKAVQEAAIDQKISVPMLLQAMEQHLGIKYSTSSSADEGISQTPVYHAIRRGSIQEADPPPFQKGKWMVVNQALHDYIYGVVERQEKEKDD